MDKRTLYIISIVALILSLLAFGYYIYLSMNQDKNVNPLGKQQNQTVKYDINDMFQRSICYYESHSNDKYGRY